MSTLANLIKPRNWVDDDALRVAEKQRRAQEKRDRRTLDSFSTILSNYGELGVANEFFRRATELEHLKSLVHELKQSVKHAEMREHDLGRDLQAREKVVADLEVRFSPPGGYRMHY